MLGRDRLTFWQIWKHERKRWPHRKMVPKLLKNSGGSSQLSVGRLAAQISCYTGALHRIAFRVFWNLQGLVWAGPRLLHTIRLLDSPPIRSLQTTFLVTLKNKFQLFSTMVCLQVFFRDRYSYIDKETNFSARVISWLWPFSKRTTIVFVVWHITESSIMFDNDLQHNLVLMPLAFRYIEVLYVAYYCN